MGIALLLLGLAAAGLVVDFAIENWSDAANEVTFSLFGGSFTANQVEVAIGAALPGALAIALVVLRPRRRAPGWEPRPPAELEAPDLRARTRERRAPGPASRRGRPCRLRRRPRSRPVPALTPRSSPERRRPDRRVAGVTVSDRFALRVEFEVEGRKRGNPQRVR